MAAAAGRVDEADEGALAVTAAGLVVCGSITHSVQHASHMESSEYVAAVRM